MACYRLIACEVFHREFCLAAASSPHRIDVEFVPQRLHNKQCTHLREVLQARIDAAEAESAYDAVLIGYGLCSNAAAGLRTRRVPLVIPRAHDCIAVLLGSHARYKEVFDANPGTYYLSSGWIERTGWSEDALPEQGSTNSPFGAPTKDSFEALVEQYGEEEARFLQETLGAWSHSYSRMAFIDLGLGNREMLVGTARRAAERMGLPLEIIPGDRRLFHALTDGPAWDASEFLVLSPGQAVEPSYDESVVCAAPCASAGAAQS